jgi:enoyl-CoA hydratase/carnithine racemase
LSIAISSCLHFIGSDRPSSVKATPWLHGQNPRVNTFAKHEFAQRNIFAFSLFLSSFLPGSVEIGILQRTKEDHAQNNGKKMTVYIAGNTRYRWPHFIFCEPIFRYANHKGERMSNEVLVERPLPGVAVLRLNRPESRNALSQQLRTALARHFTELGGDAEVRCIVLTGSERIFAAGADIRDLAERSAVEMMLRNTHRLWQAIASCPKPVIAAVNGLALGGGCELAMHADIIVAGEGAAFGQPEVRIGVMPGAGGTQRLTRAVGKFRAMKMVLTGQPVGAREALAMGLASEVVADGEVQARALALAAEIAALPPLAVMQIKEVVLAGQDASLDSALMLERKAFQLLFATRDQKEGMQAFLDKRQPHYQGA